MPLGGGRRLMAKTILNFHFDYLITSLMHTSGFSEGSGTLKAGVPHPWLPYQVKRFPFCCPYSSFISLPRPFICCPWSSHCPQIPITDPILGRSPLLPTLAQQSQCAWSWPLCLLFFYIFSATLVTWSPRCISPSCVMLQTLSTHFTDVAVWDADLVLFVYSPSPSPPCCFISGPISGILISFVSK